MGVYAVLVGAKIIALEGSLWTVFNVSKHASWCSCLFICSCIQSSFMQ